PNRTPPTPIYTLSLHDALPILDPVLEDPRIEASDSGCQFDVRRGLPHGLDVRTREEDLVAPHLDLRLSHDPSLARELLPEEILEDRKSTRLNSSHVKISYAVFC